MKRRSGVTIDDGVRLTRSRASLRSVSTTRAWPENTKKVSPRPRSGNATTTKQGVIAKSGRSLSSSSSSSSSKSTTVVKSLPGPPIDIHVIEDSDDESIVPLQGLNGRMSCLSEQEQDDVAINNGSPKGFMRPIILRRAVSIRELDDDSWLSSSLIDLVISKFAKCYTNVHFMSIDFVVLSLSGITSDKNEMMKATDITGRIIDYNSENDNAKSIVFVCNSNNIHWNLIRVVRSPQPELQLFEPMGKPVSRHGGLGFRDVPRCVVRWLDMCCPLASGGSWISTGVSAIKTQQQFTPFDCGVACLLYAEKCGLGQKHDEIHANTSQQDITDYRKVLQDFTRENGKMNAFD
jgi:hypothetical protein